jgi:phthiodiolone/phenolphthiodiolone dimycocerosates ketoreductase
VRNVKYGSSASPFPPVEANARTVQRWEQTGLDFVVYADQQSLTMPRSIWTPDLCPSAELYDIDAWLEPWPLMTEAALVSEKIRIGLGVADAVRRPPSILAQLALTLDNYAKGRFFMVLGAGETKQCTPYGLPRDRPFGRLEEILNLLPLWFNSNEPIDFDGKFWKVKNGIIGLPAHSEGGPELLVAGGPGKALRFGATLADGWLSYTPGSPSPEEYAEECAEFNRYAEQAGKDPAALTRMMYFTAVLGDDDDMVEELTHNAIVRWDTAALTTGGETWRRHGVENPLGPDWAYVRDLIPMEWSREDALRIVEQVPPSMVRKLRMCGTPQQVAEQVQPYIEAGCTHVRVLDYGALVTSGSLGEAAAGGNRLTDCYEHLRKLNGQPSLASSRADLNRKEAT